ncbi:DNA mismatch repair endonuclease MutL [Candidatus Bipolaricaulota bacterium]|nr:DNA mismatch repair endonuclease MutL [Candidatus Bipolaricaulota bacterium]
MRIHRLDEALIRKIAAGEVVDRPASVLKELVENALDAQATRVEVELRGGGIELVSVVDDGVGMTPEELRLAVERHTTSKLSSEQDLRRIRTLGFRGEALAAICAVARVRLLSRPKGGEAAHELVVEAGRVVRDRPAARPVGTTVEVHGLFSGVPARRKFLKGPAAEARAALAAARRLVLAQPAVGFVVLSEGREVLDAPPVGGPQARIGQVYGAEFARRLIPVELSEPGYELVAFFAPPEAARPTRVDQHLFLSGRPVRPGNLASPVYQAFSRYLPRGLHPAFFLYLDVDPELVDVNVHPKKEEVRFRAERLAQDLVRRAAMRALGGRTVAIGRGSQAPPRPERAEVGKETPLFSPTEGRPRPWRLLGQARRAYLVLETQEGLEIVDQHAAHERVLFEKWRADAKIPAQVLLVPVRVEVPFDRAQALTRAIPRLRELGVILEPFGGGSFLLRGWPAPLVDRQARLGFAAPILALADRLISGEPPLHELWREVACAAAIRAGEALSPKEQEELIIQWKDTLEPARCPHGRPTSLLLGWEDLARKFGRRP